MFVRDGSDDEEEEEGDSKHAGERLAAAYYRRLFKEYVLCDLSRHRKGQVSSKIDNVSDSRLECGGEQN